MLDEDRELPPACAVRFIRDQLRDDGDLLVKTMLDWLEFLQW